MHYTFLGSGSLLRSLSFIWSGLLSCILCPLASFALSLYASCSGSVVIIRRSGGFSGLAHVVFRIVCTRRRLSSPSRSPFLLPCASGSSLFSLFPSFASLPSFAGVLPSVTGGAWFLGPARGASFASRAGLGLLAPRGRYQIECSTGHPCGYDSTC